MKRIFFFCFGAFLMFVAASGAMGNYHYLTDERTKGGTETHFAAIGLVFHTAIAAGGAWCILLASRPRG